MEIETGSRALPKGRPRNGSIDAAALSEARRQLAERGLAGMSFGAVAREAGTTRQALYRRWPTKRALAESALATIEDDAAAPQLTDPYRDLVAELEDFRDGVSRPGRISLVGTMLQTTTDRQLAKQYRDRVITPRRARLRAILERAAADRLISRDADISVAITMLTGSWYARCLAGDVEPDGWVGRVADVLWRGLGGEPDGGPGSGDG